MLLLDSFSACQNRHALSSLAYAEQGETIKQEPDQLVRLLLPGAGRSRLSAGRRTGPLFGELPGALQERSRVRPLVRCSRTPRCLTDHLLPPCRRARCSKIGRPCLNRRTRLSFCGGQRLPRACVGQLCPGEPGAAHGRSSFALPSWLPGTWAWASTDSTHSGVTPSGPAG